MLTWAIGTGRPVVPAARSPCWARPPRTGALAAWPGSASRDCRRGRTGDVDLDRPPPVTAQPGLWRVPVGDVCEMDLPEVELRGVERGRMVDCASCPARQCSPQWCSSC